MNEASGYGGVAVAAAATGLLAAEFAARDVLVVAGFVVAFTGLVLSALFEPGAAGGAISVGWPFVAAVLFSGLVVSVVAHTVYYGLIQRYEELLAQALRIQ